MINRHTSDLTRTISNELTFFSSKFIELGFISRDASRNILTKQGIGNGEKGSQFLNLVIDNFQRSLYKNKFFDEFVGVFSSEAAYKGLATRDLTTSMAEEFKYCTFHTPSSPSTSHADQLPPHVNSFIKYVKRE